MTAILDTNVLVRHLTGEPRDQAARATRRLLEEHRLVLTDVVVAECAYVLLSIYRLDRAMVATLLRSALALPSIVAHDRAMLELALYLFETHAVSFADAYVSALATRSGVRNVLSFDRDFERLPAVRVEP